MVTVFVLTTIVPRGTVTDTVCAELTTVLWNGLLGSRCGVDFTVSIILRVATLQDGLTLLGMLECMDCRMFRLLVDVVTRMATGCVVLATEVMFWNMAMF